jgi:hypothetical protein
MKTSTPCKGMQSLPTSGAFCLLANVVFFRESSGCKGRHSRKLEAEWHQRLKRARSRYEEKVAIRKEMLAERSESPINLSLTPTADSLCIWLSKRNPRRGQNTCVS